MTFSWEGKRVVVTGGAGFVGSHAVDRLQTTRGVSPSQIVVPRSKNTDLRRADDAARALKGADVVLHFAASVGGIGFSKEHPATQYHDCLQIDLNVMEAARKHEVEKVVSVSSACAYPLDAPYPLKESSLFHGIPQETNRAYGFAKLMLIAQAEAYARQYGMNVVVPVATNAYGPRDHFDLENSHVIPALIRKCLSNPPELVVWGDGTPTRDFLHAQDFAEGVILAAERLDSWEPVNIASGREVSIKDLVALITRLTGYRGTTRYDPSRPGGQPRRVLDINRARQLMGFEPKVRLEDGIRETIDWYRATSQAKVEAR